MLNTVYALNALIIVAIPLLLGWYLVRRFGLVWRLFVVGMVTFVLAQIFHIPIDAGLTLAFQQGLLPQPALNQALANAIIFGLTAALTAELTKYFVLRASLQEARSWGSALLFGTGYGGAEMILVGLVAGFTFVSLSTMRQNGDTLSSLTPDQVAQLQEQLTAYWSAPWYDVFADAIKSIAALCLQISYTVLLVQVFLRAELRWLLFALGWHWLAESLRIYADFTFGLSASLLVLILALIGLGIVILLRIPESTCEKDIGQESSR